MKLPFGRFKGQYVADLPDHYLAWIATQDWVKDPLRAAIIEEYESRACQHSNNQRYLLLPSAAVAAECIIESGYRQQARKLHPDVGGDHERMLALNSAVDWLRSLIRSATEERAA
jgi:hypothetical protein